MKNLAVCLALCGFLFLASCAALQLEEPPPQPATATMTASASASATPTVTSTPLPTVTPTPDPVISDCIEIQSALPEEHSYEGFLLLVRTTHGPGERHLLYNIQSGESVYLPKEYSYASIVSPDQTKLILDDIVRGIFAVYSSNGVLLKKMSMYENQGRVAAWFDDERIAIKKYEEGFREGMSKYPASVVIVSIMNGETQLLESDYPNIDGANYLIHLGNWGTTVYDPTLTRVVYAGDVTHPGQPDKLINGYILYSLSEEKILAEIPDQDFHLGTLPQWFADGSQFIVEGEDELYLVGADGDIENLTQFNIEEDFSEKENRYYRIPGYYSLSPDESQLAFWLERNNGEELSQVTLAVLDLETGEATDTCIEYGYDSAVTITSPTWSPDSSKLVISAEYGEVENEVGLVLIDLEDHIAFQLPSDWNPTGWLLPEDE